MTLRTLPHRSGSEALCEAEWDDTTAQGGSDRGPAPTTTAIPPGLARLLAAALLEPEFGRLFLSNPADAAHRALEAPGELFGTMLPDPALCLTLPALDEGEWEILRRLPPSEDLASAARALRRVAADPAGLSAAGRAVPVRAAPRGLKDLSGRGAAASREGALAGAA